MPATSQIPPAPKTRIFLRDNFSLRAGNGPDFLTAISEQLKLATTGRIGLLAACSDTPFDLTARTAEPPPRMMHVWELPSWSSLYDAMYASAETSWFDLHQKSIAAEDQDLLVELRVAYGVDAPNLKRPHVYMYEEIRIPGHRFPAQFLFSFNHVVAEVRKRGWRWIWSATQITSQPQVLCLLWEAPCIDSFVSTLTELRGSADYNAFMQQITQLERRIMFPTEVEALAAKAG